MMLFDPCALSLSCVPKNDYTMPPCPLGLAIWIATGETSSNRAPHPDDCADTLGLTIHQATMIADAHDTYGFEVGLATYIEQWQAEEIESIREARK